jgi:glutathione synthase/RimK-type ligase-like ATP-grasp enzyme
MLHILKLLIILLIRVYSSIKKVGIPIINNNKAQIIIWAPNFFSLSFLLSDNLQKLFSSYLEAKKSNQKATIYLKKDIGYFRDKIIVYFGDSRYNVYGFYNYVNVIHYISNSLVDQGNNIYPKPNELMLWENKIYMHELFERLKIRTPKSKIFDIHQLNFNLSFQYPILIKEPHSCSSDGVHLVSNVVEFKNLLNNQNFKNRNRLVIAQELLNMRSDLRVILVGEEIVWHYWRKNTSAEWKPTSTGRGGGVDFSNFPEKWRMWIIEKFKLLNLISGAFDIAWEGDDYTSEPYILEVSPFYQPNPEPKNKKNLESYGNWKKSLKLKDNYQVASVNLLFNIQGKVIKEFLRTIEKDE